MRESGACYTFSDLFGLASNQGRILLFGSGHNGKKIANILSQLGLRFSFIDASVDEKSNAVCESGRIPLREITLEDSVFLTCDTLKEQEMAEDLLIRNNIKKFYYFDQTLYLLDCNLQWYLDLLSVYGAKEFGNVEELEKEFSNLKEKYESINVYRMWSSRVGEMIYRFEIMRLALASDEKCYNLIIPYLNGSVAGIANKCLMNIFSRYLNIVQDSTSAFWQYVFLFHASELNGTRANYYDRYQETSTIIRDSQYVPFVELNEEEIREAKIKFDELHINNEYVCIHARDDTYLSRVYQMDSKDLAYNDHRDFSIYHYGKLVDYLAQENISVVRMGNGGKEKFDHPNVADFAMESYDELLDLYLNSRCKYYVGTYTGATVMPKLFGKNVIYVNITSMIYMFYLDCANGKEIYAPKLMYSESKDRFLSIKEMLEYEWMVLATPRNERGSNELIQDVLYVENTEDDILDVYIEADKRYRGIWQDDEQEEELQKRYNEMLDEFKAKHPNCPYYPNHNIEDCIIPHTISSIFLRKHQFLV